MWLCVQVCSLCLFFCFVHMRMCFFFGSFHLLCIFWLSCCKTARNRSYTRNSNWKKDCAAFRAEHVMCGVYPFIGCEIRFFSVYFRLPLLVGFVAFILPFCSFNGLGMAFCQFHYGCLFGNRSGCVVCACTVLDVVSVCLKVNVNGIRKWFFYDNWKYLIFFLQ